MLFWWKKKKKEYFGVENGQGITRVLWCYMEAELQPSGGK